MFIIYKESFKFQVQPPFRLDLTVWTLRRRAKNIIDRWHGGNYIRVVVVDKKVIKISVSQNLENNEICVTLESESQITPQIIQEVKLLLQKMLGLNISLEPFYKIAAKNKILNPLAVLFKGIRPPRFPTIFEALINAITCQQVSLDVGILVLNRLTETYGKKIIIGSVPFSAFPRPVDLAKIPEEEIKKTGLSYQKARAIKELSMGIVSGEVDLSKIEKMTNIDAVKYLSSLRGIGRWSAEYALLRGLGRLDTFPGDDVGAQNNLQRLFELSKKPNYEEIKKLTRRWHPYEGLVYFHLLLQKLSMKGAI